VLAEDNHDTAQTMAILLRKLGHEVKVVHEGAAAITKPDVVLMDIGLPGLNGYEVADRLRQQPELNAVRLIALSGYGQPQDCERSKMAGFEHHLVKPISFENLQAVLSEGDGNDA
jgi:CheY-like chemotaxis protein